ncbi:winged helix-turn-helix transcriptional regulator [Oceanidesulfovibrio marinus]|uniref:Transcriptional regulator n=1 Tax=Oceanidesulfovibrio marinus TaxID=370038 RepID=A0A6P1ZFY7_9BACT|nr:helix-turn-helix domain-containing protein [Oceanidesulfovibrio marinus]QJT09496.1 helix-turn-helix transcriptional regulator [Oceanidesulfovibrio marinus]TVM33721.1 transcriptional regulator [Oceanidesulfovibrio marinus]
MSRKTAYDVSLPKGESLYERDEICPIIYALDIIGGKWKLPILWHLADQEAVRYNELKRGVTGITNMMLTKCLRELEENGLVVRVQYPEVPPRVEYSLTERGRELLPALNKLNVWGKEQIKYIRARGEESN